MTDGTFRTWEMVALGFSGVIFIFSMFYYDLSNGYISKGADPKLMLISVTVMALGLFAKPIWLLGNWKKIRTWEHATVIVRQSYTTGRGRGTRYHMYIEFFSKDGKAHHKSLEGRYTANFKVGEQYEIMFAEEYIDALIFVPLAFRQAVGSAILGVLLEAGFVLSLILL